MYFYRNGERVNVRGIKDLVRGDKVYVTTYCDQYVPVEVARVRTVECATIVTIKKSPKVETLRYVGYHTGSQAQGDDRKVLTMYAYSADRMERALERANEVCDEISARAEALHALKVLRHWLGGNNDEVFDDKILGL